VIEENNIVKARQVKATKRVDDLWLIEEGLTSQDQVVIDGLQKVASGMEIVPVPTEFESPISKNN
jgi:membrane fusion protein (multidrug efflux system)